MDVTLYLLGNTIFILRARERIFFKNYGKQLIQLYGKLKNLIIILMIKKVLKYGVSLKMKNPEFYIYIQTPMEL